MTTSAGLIEILVNSSSALEEQLEAAIRELQQLALVSQTHGILLTRHRHGLYTAELSDHVPFGTTQELDRLHGQAGNISAQ